MEERIEFKDAQAQGVIEYGYISLGIGGEDISITIEQSSVGIVKYLLDDIEFKEKLESLGIEFEGDEKIVGPKEFLLELYYFYDSKTTEKR
jgi:hypothetical protein